MLPCRLIVDPPAAGVWNMAVDEALLEQAAREGVATLRFYQWNPPTLSLGYFQRLAERDRHAASRGAPIVRRLSGGGALLHDRELTYSLCLPGEHALTRQSTSIYGLVHRELVAAMRNWRVEAQLCQELPMLAAAELRTEKESFLCFARRSPDDVVVAHPLSPHGFAKIAGSAQRRRRGAILQHGSVLLDASPLASELPGIRQACGIDVDPRELAEAWCVRLADTLKLSLNRTIARDAAPQSLVAPLLPMFESSQWTARR